MTRKMQPLFNVGLLLDHAYAPSIPCHVITAATLPRLELEARNILRHIVTQRYL